MAKHYDLGKKGEEIAANYLTAKGYQIMERNWRFGKDEIDFDIEGKIVVLIDDVLFTGRTIRCALSQLIDLGRPKAIQLAVLIDRGHRELPIRADYVGKNIPSNHTEEIIVRFQEDTGKDEVLIIKKDQDGEPSEHEVD